MSITTSVSEDISIVENSNPGTMSVVKGIKNYERVFPTHIPFTELANIFETERLGRAADTFHIALVRENIWHPSNAVTSSPIESLVVIELLLHEAYISAITKSIIITSREASVGIFCTLLILR